MNSIKIPGFRFFAILLVCLAYCTETQCSFISRYNATFVTMDDGLSSNYIDDIYEDSHGFLWLATGGGGLIRYDGYEFLEFSANTPRTRLRSNFITNVCEDKFSRLWIVSEDGLDILDLNRLLPAELTDNRRLLESIRRAPCSCVTRDANGCIWLKAGSSLYRVSFGNDGSITHIDEYNDKRLNRNDIICKDVDNDGTVWVAMGGQFYKIGSRPGSRLTASLVSRRLRTDGEIYVSDYELKEDEVWISTERGLYRYNKNTGNYKHYTHIPADPYSLSQDFLTGLAVTPDKQLLVASLKGINVYNPITDNFEWVCDAAGADGSRLLNSNFVNCLTIIDDRIWVGTESGGLNKLSPKRLAVSNYLHDPKNPSSLAMNPVNAVYEDSSHRLWVGTVESGLNMKEPGRSGFVHFTHDNSGLSHNSVSSITSDPQGRMWIGTWGGGINLMSLSKPGRVEKVLSVATGVGVPIDFVGALIYDSVNNVMWVGTASGIFIYDMATERIEPALDHQTKGCIGACIDNHGRLWMGSLEGVFIFDLHSRRRHPSRGFDFTHLKYKLDAPGSGLMERVSCIYMSRDGTMWVGSRGNGLYKEVKGHDGKQAFVAYTRDNGLPNNSVKGILEDDSGRLWISTDNGLAQFAPSKGQFVNYISQDGLVGPQFYWNSACRSSDGRLWFGNVKGLVAVDPSALSGTPHASHLRFTSLRVAGRIVQPGTEELPLDISISREIVIHEREKSFALEFSALDYELDKAGTYSYRMLGFSDEWTPLPKGRRFINYTNLSPGNYELQVKYTDLEGKDSPEVATLKIHVKPYFYKTWWFILMLIVPVAFGVWQLYQWRVRDLKAQRERLHRVVEQRTHELQEQKKLLEKKTDELYRHNTTLQERNEEITRQKTQLAQLTQKVQQLTVDRISFFTNITHEFRTPITLIMGPIERALKLSYNPQVIEQLHFVERNSRYLLSLVNQLMDFRKVESGKFEVLKTRHNILRFADEVVTPFVVFARERNVEVRHYYRTPAELCYDEEAMHKVLTNLLSNAVKFTPDNGHISLYICLLPPKPVKGGGTAHRLYICVSDTGCGIPEEDLGKIFHRFYQSQGQVRYPMYGQSGSGIGLYLCKRIVQAQGGEMSVKNNRRGGCSMRIMLFISDEEAKIVTSPAAMAAGEAAPPVVPRISAADRKRLTILLVEDNADMRSFITSILREHYNIVEAANGQEAWDILMRQSVDFIISDLMMPVVDGLELSRRVKGNFALSHIPFLMLTAKTSPEARLESYRTGVDEYIMKPFDETMLLTRIDNILEARRRYQRKFSNGMDVNELNIVEESSDKKFINKVMEVLKEHYKNSYFEVSDFSELIGISKSLLNKKLQNLVGQPAGQLIRSYRLNIAHELILKNSKTRNMNIAEIAYEVGFNDPKYFTRCFTRHFNITPSALLNGAAESGEHTATAEE